MKVRKNKVERINVLREKSLRTKKISLNKRKFIKGLDISDKVINMSIIYPMNAIIYPESIQNTVNLVLESSLNMANFILKNFFIEKIFIVAGRNFMYTISDTLQFSKSAVTIKQAIKSKKEIKNDEKKLIENNNYEWIKLGNNIEDLNKKREEIKDQIEILMIKKGKINLEKENNKELNNLEIKIKKKMDELSCINKYIAISNIKKINRDRLSEKIKNMVYTSIDFVSSSALVIFGILVSVNPIVTGVITGIICTNFAIRYGDIFLDSVTNFFRDMRYKRIKRQYAENIVKNLSNISANSIDNSIVFGSRLGKDPLVQNDFDMLLRIKDKISSISQISLDKEVHNALK